MAVTTHIDHLVVAAPDLERGVTWCQHTFGLPPGPGGQHPLMGTHNRLLRVATVKQPFAYLEIIAIDPEAAAPSRTRWFDLDDPALQDRLRRDGPRLIHWVVQVPDVRRAVAALATQGIDCGAVVAASRSSEHGLLQWQITVRDDGRRLFDGCLPTLIEWTGTHPSTGMPESGITLEQVALTHPHATALRAALAAIGLESVPVREGPAGITAVFAAPRGTVALQSEN